MIINADNSDDDRTIVGFQNTRTTTEKLCLPTGGIGKGDNVYAGLKIVADNNINHAILIDADLRSFNFHWLERMLHQLNFGNDLVLPLYSRYWIEGNATNHFCMPLIYSFTGKLIQQPIAGDIALNLKLVKRVLREPVTDSFRQYGIDILISGLAVKEKFNISQIELSQKIHNPSFDKADSIFLGEATALYDIFKDYKFSKKAHDELHLMKFLPSPSVANSKLIDREELTKNMLAHARYPFGKYEVINSENWADILVKFVSAFRERDIRDSKQLTKDLLPYYLLRTVDYIRSSNGDENTAHEIITNQVRLIRDQIEQLYA